MEGIINREARAQLHKKHQIEEYNSIPVWYCTDCLSLRVRRVYSSEDYDDEECNYCDYCSSTNIESCSYAEWEQMYKERYGHKYLDEYRKRVYKSFF